MCLSHLNPRLHDKPETHTNCLVILEHYDLLQVLAEYDMKQLWSLLSRGLPGLKVTAIIFIVMLWSFVILLRLYNISTWMMAEGPIGMLSALVSRAVCEIRLWHELSGVAEELLKCMQSGSELVTRALKPFITVAKFKTAGRHGAWCWNWSYLVN